MELRLLLLVFGKGLRITERAVKRLSGDIKVYSMDIEDQSEVDEASKKQYEKEVRLL